MISSATNTSIFFVTISLGGLPTKAEESLLPMRQTNPRRTPTRYFMVSERANRYYTLLKGDLEVIVAKGNLIIPRRNSTTGCSFVSYPGQLLLLLLLLLLWWLLSRAPDAYCAQPKKIHLFAFIVCRLFRHIVFLLLLLRFQYVSLRIYFDFVTVCDLFVLRRGI